MSGTLTEAQLWVRNMLHEFGNALGDHGRPAFDPAYGVWDGPGARVTYLRSPEGVERGTQGEEGVVAVLREQTCEDDHAKSRRRATGVRSTGNTAGTENYSGTLV